MHKEKFIYEIRENAYRIKIISERPKIRIDKYIYGNIQIAIKRRNEILTKYNMKLYKEFRIKCKLKDVTVHGLRHSYCSAQVNENPNLSICDVSKIMGHSQISTTLKYSHVTKSKKEEVYSIFR